MIEYKTKDEIEYDIYYLTYKFLKDRGLKGGVFLSDRRNDSKTEDCSIRCTSLINRECYQEGEINVNVYVPYIDYGGTRKEKNTGRTIEIGKILKELNNDLISLRGKMELERSGYYLEEEEGIYSFEVESKKETLVNNKLSFKYYG